MAKHSYETHNIKYLRTKIITSSFNRLDYQRMWLFVCYLLFLLFIFIMFGILSGVAAVAFVCFVEILIDKYVERQNTKLQQEINTLLQNGLKPYLIYFNSDEFCLSWNFGLDPYLSPIINNEAEQNIIVFLSEKDKTKVLKNVPFDKNVTHNVVVEYYNNCCSIYKSYAYNTEVLEIIKNLSKHISSGKQTKGNKK